MMGDERVRVAAFGGARVDVHGGGVEPRHLVQQPVLSVDGDGVAFADTEGALYGDVGFGAQPVAQPAELQTVDALNAGNCAEGGLGRVDEFRFYRVHQPAVDVSGCASEYEDDGDGDQ